MTRIEEIKQRLELSKPENCRQIIEDYEYLLERIERLEGALNHYTKHPKHWDKDENGNLIDEGPSQVAIEALKESE